MRKPALTFHKPSWLGVLLRSFCFRFGWEGGCLFVWGVFGFFLGGVVLFCFVLLYLDREIFFADSLICVSDKRKTLNDPINFTLQVRILDCEFVQTYDV